MPKETYTLRDGSTVPRQILIGVEPDKWILTVLYNERQAAEWLGNGERPEDPGRRVFRAKLSEIEELVRVPPVPPSVSLQKPKWARGLGPDDE